MTTNLRLASLLRCWAANIEDVSLRWHGHPEDLQVLIESAEDMLAYANELDDPPPKVPTGRKLVDGGVEHYLDSEMCNKLLDAGLIHRPVKHLLNVFTVTFPHSLHDCWEHLYGPSGDAHA